MNIDQSKIEDAVIAQAVEQIVQGTNEDYQFKQSILKRVGEIITEKVQSQVDGFLRDGLSSLTFKDTNTHGEKKGPDKTLLEFVDDRITKHLSDLVDSNGKKTDSWGSSDRQSRLGWIIQLAAEKEIKKHVETLATEMRGEIAKSIMGLTCGKINAAFADVLRDIGRKPV